MNGQYIAGKRLTHYFNYSGKVTSVSGSHCSGVFFNFR